MYKLALAFVSFFFLIATPAAAAGSPQPNWIVTQLSGDARVVHPGAQAASLKVNNQLAPGDTLLTGPTGRATLVRGGDYIIVAPGSELRVPSKPQPSGFTRVIQNLGTLLFKVQHTGVPHFAVDTPMLAAVVKGTTFTVVVDQHRSAVQVIQGVVQVNAVDGGMSRMVEGGRTVFVNHDHPRMLLDADKPAPPNRAPSSTTVAVSAAGESPLATIASLTGGLVRADLSPPQPALIISGTTVQAVPTVPADQSTAPSSAPVIASVTAPATNGPTATSPAPTVTTAPGATVVAGAAPVVTTPVASPPTGSAPSVTTPTVTAPAVTTPAVTTPVVTAPSVTTPTVTVPSATVPTVTTPVVTIPSVTTPSVTVPSVTTPTVTVPAVTTPVLTTPIVSVPTVTTPTVTVPTVNIGSNSGPGSLNSGPGSLSSGSGSSGGLLSGLLKVVGTTVGTVTGVVLPKP